MKFLTLFLVTLISTASFAELDLVSKRMKFWDAHFEKEVPSYTYDSNIIEWAKKNNFTVKMTSDWFRKGEEVLVIKTESVKSISYECKLYDVLIVIQFNEFGQFVNHRLERKSTCE